MNKCEAKVIFKNKKNSSKDLLLKLPKKITQNINIRPDGSVDLMNLAEVIMSELLLCRQPLKEKTFSSDELMTMIYDKKQTYKPKIRRMKFL